MPRREVLSFTTPNQSGFVCVLVFVVLQCTAVYYFSHDCAISVFTRFPSQENDNVNERFVYSSSFPPGADIPPSLGLLSDCRCLLTPWVCLTAPIFLSPVDRCNPRRIERYRTCLRRMLCTQWICILNYLYPLLLSITGVNVLQGWIRQSNNTCRGGIYTVEAGMETLCGVQ